MYSECMPCRCSRRFCGTVYHVDAHSVHVTLHLYLHGCSVECGCSECKGEDAAAVGPPWGYFEIHEQAKKKWGAYPTEAVSEQHPEKGNDASRAPTCRRPRTLTQDRVSSHEEASLKCYFNIHEQAKKISPGGQSREVDSSSGAHHCRTVSS